MRLPNISLRNLLIRVVLLAVVDVFAVQLAIILGNRVSPILGILLGLFTIFVNVVFLDDRFYAWRWISPALFGMVLLVVYPIGYSLIVAFTNRGDGHNLSKQQALTQFAGEYYAAANAPTYQVYIYRSDAGKFRFWLVDEQKKTYIATQDETGLAETAATDSSVGELDNAGLPKALGEYKRVNATQYTQALQNLSIDIPPNRINFKSGLQLTSQSYKVKALLRKYTYDPAADTMTDNETGLVYRNDLGTFVNTDGEKKLILDPGFESFVGLNNLLRVVRDENVRDPFWRVFVWTIAFALGSVFTTFALGLGFALLLNGRDIPFRPVWRSLLIIPYAIPGYLSAVTWKGLMNPVFGPVNLLVKGFIGVSPNWWSDPALAKVAILFINLYLGFPYMMLICLGALQSIPADMYEAALIDGANSRQQFRFITLPMLLLAVGPLLVASFAYNFNNFTLIQLVNQGGPPISAGTVAGHTDILISYTYRLAFSGAAGADYGFASAISIFIFLIIGTITFVNFRFTRQLEEISQNV